MSNICILYDMDAQAWNNMQNLRYAKICNSEYIKKYANNMQKYAAS